MPIANIENKFSIYMNVNPHNDLKIKFIGNYH